VERKKGDLLVKEVDCMILKIYDQLLEYFGPRNWWPADSKFEVIVGAILTQQTTWKNVEKAIENLKEHNLIDAEKLFNLQVKKLETLIKPCGFFRLKTKRLRSFLKFFIENFDADLERMFKKNLKELREELLSVHGIGRETCDSILLYAGEKPIFVVDAYTFRLCERYPIINSRDYEEVREFFEKNLPKDVNLFKEFHALIVELGKNYCKTKPLCKGCPLSKGCKHEFSTNDL
jgi:endonuclease-3 related protein